MKQLKMIILLTMLLSMVGAKAFAYDFEADGIYYNYSADDGNSVYVTYKSRNEVTYTGDIVVPSSVSHMGNTYKVVAIGEYAFFQQNVNGYYRSITSISLPNTIKTIGVYAFSSNKELGSISIPASVTEIKDWAFSSCEGLTTVVLQKGLNKIAGCAFMNCSSLSNINIPNGVTTIGHNAFTFCDIKELFLPKTVTELGINPFGCRNLASIIVDDENPVYDSRHNCNAIIETATNRLISCCINTDIPSSVQTIGRCSFRNIERPSLIIPEGVTNIEESAFWQSHILSFSIPSTITSISISYGNWGGAKIIKVNMPLLPKLSESIGDEGYLKKIVLYVPKGCKPLYEGATYWKNFGSIREMGETLPGAHVISFKDQLVKALCVSQWDTDNDGELSEEEAATVTSIGAAFMGQEITSFDEFQYFTGVKEIEYQAFKDCRVLTSIIIPQSVNSIGSSAFFGCTGFISVVSMIKEPFAINPWWTWDGVKVDEIPLYVPKGTKGLYEATEGWNVFKNIVEMEPPSPNIEFADANVKALCVANWDANGDGELSEAEAAAVTDLESVFKHNKKIVSFDELHYFVGLNKIGDYAFNGCTALESIKFPENVTEIGEWAFYDNNALCSVDMGNNVKKIGGKAFLYCTGLTSIKIPESVESIGVSSLGHCHVLETIKLPSNLTSIDDYAFQDCYKLSSINIPSKVESIGVGIVIRCDKMSSIMVNKDNEKYDSRDDCNAIIETSSNTLIAGCKNTNIPYGIIGIGKCAFGGVLGLNSITLPNSLKSINEHAFIECKNLNYMIVPNGVVTIGQGAFEECERLRSIELPSSLSSIGSGAFDLCSSLVSVTINKTMPINIGYDIFSNRKNATLYVPYGSKAAYGAANYWKEFKEIVEMEDPNEVTVTDISQMDNVIYVEPVEARCGVQTALSIKMKNSVAVQTIQFDLYLPDGVTIVRNEDDELITASKERIKKYQYFSSSIQSDGALRLLAQATTTNIAAGDGEICQVIINIPEDMKEGEYPLVLKEMCMIEKDNTNHSPSPNLVRAKLVVSSYIPGDANGDGEVNAIDFNIIGNYILGFSQSKFNEKAADINGDGEINAIDFNMVANIILYGIANASPKLIIEDYQDPS